MSQGRRHFTDEFKREAVALLVSSGRPLSRIASELGISASMLRNWRNGSGGRDAGSARHTIPASTPHSAPDPGVEISRLRRENDRLRTERDILKRLWPSSRNRRDEVPLDRGPPGYLVGACHVRGAERGAVGLLRVAVTAGQPTQDRQSRAAGRHPAGPCAAPGTIRSAAHPRRTARRGPNRQPQAGRTGHAPAWYPGADAAPLSRVYSKHCLPVAANLEQNFVAHRPDQVWLADITYIPTSQGW